MVIGPRRQLIIGRIRVFLEQTRIVIDNIILDQQSLIFIPGSTHDRAYSDCFRYLNSHRRHDLLIAKTGFKFTHALTRDRALSDLPQLYPNSHQ